MALPCGRTACFLLLRHGRAITTRRLSGSCWSGSQQQNKSSSGTSSQWKMMAAVCLQRLPVISTDANVIEQEFESLMHQMELEKSRLSDHELRLLEDAESLRRKQSDNYDPDEDDHYKDQDIVLTQDLEDMWEQKMKSFEPAPRVRDDVDQDLTSPRRCLDQSLVLVEQQVNEENRWLMPQTEWREGETLRETAQRSVSTWTDLNATFLSNAPCGVYKFKFPRSLRSDSFLGVKVFFFKAFLSDGGAAATSDPSRMWLRKAELERFLQPQYRTKVDRFLMDL